MPRNNFISKTILLTLVMVLISCSHRLNKNVLTFFFDGVPVTDSINTNIIVSQEAADSSDVFSPLPIEESNDFTVHYPYKEKDCYSCHDEKSKSELKMSQPDICYSCHEDYSQKYKYVHGPVAGGYCTSCHNPHMSKAKKLLIRSGQDLCLDCHFSKPGLSVESHKDIADSECILCHNPHGGEDRKILN